MPLPNGQLCSAYIQIFNDWSILPYTLDSLIGIVDEIVILDGCYEWMESYLTALGRDPTRSDERVYEAVRASGIPFKIVDGVWPDQLAKRIAGYRACTHDWIFRIDADEVFFFNKETFHRFFQADHAVGDMEMPTWMAPGLLLGQEGHPTHPRQCFLFDRKRISAEVHLNYLWLVLEADRRPADGEFPQPVFDEPLAFNTHLTGWRTADTSTNRAAYYTTNWMRGNGVPWLDGFEDKPLCDFELFFEKVPPADFLRLLEVNSISLGQFRLKKNEFLIPSIDTIPDDAVRNIYDNFLKSLTSLNRRISKRHQTFISGIPFYIDITTNEAQQIVAKDGVVCMEVSSKIHTAQATLIHLLASSNFPGSECVVSFCGAELSIYLPQRSDFPSDTIRSVLEITVSSVDEHAGPLRTFRLDC